MPPDEGWLLVPRASRAGPRRRPRARAQRGSRALALLAHIHVAVAASSTATQTGTLSGTVSGTATSSWTKSSSASVTVPSASLTATQSVSLATGTASQTQSETQMGVVYSGVVEPPSFVQHQEIRVRVTAKLSPTPSPSAPEIEAFDLTNLNSAHVAMYRWRPVLGTNCADYRASGVLLGNTSVFGLTEDDRSDNRTRVSVAMLTLKAPEAGTPFVLCFRNTHPAAGVYPSRTWQMLTDESGGSVQYVYDSMKSRTWYRLPEASAGQFAVIQLLSTEVNFTYPAQGCGRSASEADMLLCGGGDNLKVVPAGAPCTAEEQSADTPYLGSGQVDSNGVWALQALPGLARFAAAGGAGRFGTQYANPLVDEWTQPGTYYAANEESYSSTWTATKWDLGAYQHAYVYVRLSTEVGASFDVCYSSRLERAAVSGLNLTVANTSLPLWRKLPRCVDAEAGCGAGGGELSFTIVPEVVGWSMFDLTPNSWGTILFDDSGQGQMNNAPALGVPISGTSSAFPVAPTSLGASARANYWEPGGGDHFRLVPVSMFDNVAAAGENAGSWPAVGCWSRGMDSPVATTAVPNHGGWANDGAEYPIGAYDLTGDPSSPTSAADAAQQAATFSTVWVPPELTRWYVCYRRTCNGGTCAKHTGFRVLPWHYGDRGNVPRRWWNLDSMYSPGLGAGASQLVPFEYGADATWDRLPAGLLVRVESEDATVGNYLAPHPPEHRGYPPAVTWYMNDTREGTWGPLLVEKVNFTEYSKLDTRRWNFVRDYPCGSSGCDRVRDTVGSALRLVATDKPCDYPGFVGAPESAESLDAGAVECNSKSAETDTTFCMGSAADVAAVSTAAFYVRVPAARSGGYRVCLRLHGWNWREIWPTPEGTVAWGDANQPSGARRRMDWTTPRSAASTNAGLGPDNWFTVSSSADSPRMSESIGGPDDRAGMETLFVVSDTKSTLAAAGRRECAGGCDASGDVLRLVPLGTRCDINPTVWSASAAALADTHLSIMCPRAGAGAVERSGLYSTATAGPMSACEASAGARDMCRGAVCSPSAFLEVFKGFAENTPHPFDDVVPGDEDTFNHGTVAASIVVPPHSPDPSKNSYTICYKQVGLANWVMFNESWEVQPGQPYELSHPSGWTLLGGELQKFELSFPEDMASNDSTAVRPGRVASFHAKLVRRTALDNDNCLGLPGGTEAESLAAATTRFRVGSSRRRVEFHLVVPQQSGEYWLCVQVRRTAWESISWYRPVTPFEVTNNGVRWFVTAGNQPTNRGQSTVQFIRCRAAADGSCAQNIDLDVFNTTKGGDAVKIVRVNRSSETDSCHAGMLPYHESADHGCSINLAAEGGGVAGIIDLGPGDGPADVAEALMTMPATASDVVREYKVCVKSEFHVGGTARVAWVEVEQANMVPGQVRIITADARPRFITQPARLTGWSLAAALRPQFDLITGSTLQGAALAPNAAAVGLAGASTSYVSGMYDAPAAAEGFSFHESAAGSGGTLSEANEFKLVLAARPTVSTPPAGSSAPAWVWERLPSVSCLAPAADTASNLDACTEFPSAGGVCPSLSNLTGGVLRARFNVPVAPGMYMVCYRIKSESLLPQPWLWLPGTVATLPAEHTFSSAGASCTAPAGVTADYLFTSPTFLSFDAAAANVSVHDLRTADSADGTVASSLSSWCRRETTAVGEGAPCVLSQSGTFLRDMVSVVNGSQMCSLPTLASLTDWTALPAGWHNLERVSNSTTAVSAASSTTFSVPPANRDPTGRYKICVFKAGDGSALNASVAGAPNGRWLSKKGIVYQVPSYQDGSGFVVDAAASTKLHVTADLVVNSTLRFLFWDNMTEELYRDIPRDLLTEEYSGLTSNTPVLRSGASIDFIVRAGTNDSAVAHGRHAVWVEKCATPSSWADLACGATSSNAFVVRNLEGACSNEQGPKYGWSEDGLRQFLDAGTVRFRLQYRSSCTTPGRTNQWGCGLRFTAERQDGGRIHSPPAWVNVEDHWPDALQIDGNEVDHSVGLAELGVERLSGGRCASAEQLFSSSESQLCYMKDCWHMQQCAVMLQGRWRGPADFAANGTVSVLYSEQDYRHSLQSGAVPTQLLQVFSSGSWREATNVPWGNTGAASYSAVPQLRSGLDEGYVFLNITFAQNTSGAFAAGGGGWTRMVIRVRRRQPSIVRAVDVLPLDLDGSPPLSGAGTTRTPAPIWHARTDPSSGVPDPGATLVAEAGSYLESLVPYELSYEVCGDGSEPCGAKLPVDIPSPLDGWTLTASVRGEAENAVLPALTSYRLDGRLRFSAANLLTSPLYTAQGLLKVAPGNMGSGAQWRQWFRVKNSLGCSRFNERGGCAIDFSFEKGSARIVATLVTPVRVVAQGVRVQRADGGPLETTATITDGIVVTVVPGTLANEGGVSPERWLVDEFHYGEIFAMISGPAPTTGVVNRDGTGLVPSDDVPVDGSLSTCEFDSADGCAMVRYVPRRVGNTWGARWRMRTTKPCRDCQFTFHSSWGAGPEAREDGSLGITKMTFEDDTVGIACLTSVASVETPEGATASGNFSVYVQPQNSAGLNTVWPLWWVFTDPATDVAEGDGVPFRSPALRMSGTSVQTLTARMQRRTQPEWAGSGSSVRSGALFENLYFEGAGLAADQHKVTVTFHTAAAVYDPELVGSVMSSSAEHSCSATVTLKRGLPRQSVTFLEVVGSSGAEPLCASAAGCTKWWATTDVDQISFSVRFMNVSEGQPVQPDTSDRNITVRIGRQVPFVCTGPDAACTSSCATAEGCMLQSAAVNNEFVGWDGAVYTYGRAPLDWSKQLVQGKSAPRGAGTITLTHPGAVSVRSPVNAGAFSICAAVTVGGVEVIDTRSGWRDGDPCVNVEMWVLVQEPALQNAVYQLSPTGGAATPGNEGCGRGSTLFEMYVLTYFVLPSLSATRRFIVFERPLSYQLTVDDVSGQEGNLLSPTDNLNVTNRTLTVSNSVLPSMTRQQVLENSSAMTRSEQAYPYPSVRFRFYGLLAKPQEAGITVAATDLSASALAVQSTATPPFRWVPPRENHTLWDVEAEVVTDDECPRKRALAVESMGYRTYADTPGQGWKYADGVSVGTPFPIQTVVKTTSAGSPTRSWTFKDSLVVVRKLQWSGCNDGGRLSVLDMSRSVAAESLKLLDGKAGSFTDKSASGVATTMGAATAWLEFSDPCQSCVLQLRLCYSGATSSSDCFDNSGADQNLSPGSLQPQPAFALRTRTTRPFAVQYQAPSHVVAVSQVLPESTPVPGQGDLAGVRVGEPFTVATETVRKFGKWTMPVTVGGVVTELRAVARWDPAEDGEDATRMMYGSGGFMYASHPDLRPCNVPAGSLATTRLGTVSMTPQISFFFTRPCHRCSVWIRWAVRWTPPGGSEEVRSGDFALREYGSVNGMPVPAGVMQYRVTTCGDRWLLAGLPPKAVRKSEPFSVTAWQVDANNLPTWSSVIQSIEVVFRTAESYGNGGGGEMVVSSRVTNKETPVVGGTATFRGALTRACWNCSVLVAGIHHSFGVISEPRQIIAVAPPKRYTATQEAVPGVPARWEYTLYGADEYGERSYAVGGPTLLAWQRLYRQRKLTGTALSVLPHNGDLAAAAAYIADVGSSARAVQTRAGTPAMRVTNGTVVFNGIPYGELANPADTASPGTAVVELSGEPAVGVEVRFAVGSHAALPTRFVGGKLPPVVDRSIAADRIAVTSPPLITLPVGVVRTLKVFTVGMHVNASNGSAALHRSVLPTDARAVLSENCSACPGCRLSYPSGRTAQFVRGQASFDFLFFLTGDGAAGRHCNLTVTTTKPLPKEAPQTVQLIPQPVKLSRWAWTASDTFKPVGLPSYTAVSARAVANVTTEMRLRVWDEAFEETSAMAGVQLSSGMRVRPNLDPPGCFVCDSFNTVGCVVKRLGEPHTLAAEGKAPYGSEITFDGKFVTPGGRTDCAIIDLTGLPPGTSFSQPLTVEVDDPVAIRAVNAVLPGLLRRNFSGLLGRTNAGEPALVAGTTAKLVFETLDGEGNVAVGDQHTAVELRGGRLRNTEVDCDCLASLTASGEAPQPETTLHACYVNCEFMTLTTQANAGVVTFEVGAEPILGPTGLQPWRFVAVTSFLQGRPEPPRIYIGPLHVVTEGSQLYVEMKPHGGSWVEIQQDGSRSYTVDWVWGYPFALRIRAYDTVDRGVVCEQRERKDLCEAEPACEWLSDSIACVSRGTTVERANIPRGGDVGSLAAVLFRALEVPCYNVDLMRGTAGVLPDQPWIRKTCVVEGQCEDVDLPECAGGGWTLGDGGANQHQLRLTNGEASVSRVVYTGETGGRAWEGEAAFLLTTSDFAGGEAAPYSFLGQVRFQKLSSLRIAGSSLCEDDGAGTRCVPPAPGFQQSPSQTTINVGHVFVLTAELLDAAGRVAVGDNASSLQLSVTCTKDQHPDFLLGVMGGAGGDLVSTPLGWNVAVAMFGKASFKDLGFQGTCGEATVTLTCVAGEQLDPHGTCRGKTVTTFAFAVVDNRPRTPLPTAQRATPAPLLYPLFTLSLRGQSLGGFDAGSFTTVVEKALKMTVRPFVVVRVVAACVVPAAEAAAGIPSDRSGLLCLGLEEGRRAAAAQDSVLLVTIELASPGGATDAAELERGMTQLVGETGSPLHSSFPLLDPGYLLFHPPPAPVTPNPTGAPPVTPNAPTPVPVSTEVRIRIESGGGRVEAAAAVVVAVCLAMLG